MRKCVIADIDEQHEEVTIEPIQALLALTKSKIWCCDHCTWNKADGTLVFHPTAEDEDKDNWNDTLSTVQALQ